MRDSAEMLKEQLRSKEKEIKKSKADQARVEAKVKHILEISKEKIKDLQYEVEKKELQIQKTQSSSGKFLGGAETDKGIAFADKDNEIEGLAEADKNNEVIKNLQKKLKAAVKEKEDLANELKKATTEINKVVETKEVKDPSVEGLAEEDKNNEVIANLQKKLEAAVKEKEDLANELKKATPEINKVVETKEVKDPRVMEALKKLKQDNDNLKERITQHNSKNTEHEKQKEQLLKEVKRLRDQPQPSKKIADVHEINNQENIESYQKLIDEKDELIKSFEKIMDDSRDIDNSDKLPPDIIKDLKTNLDKIEKEKQDLEKKLNDNKDSFKKKLNEQIKLIEEEFESKQKNNTPDKKQDDHVCEEGAPLWMATFSDMVTLIMVFFILMYAIASKNVSTFKSAIIGADAKSIGVLEALNAVEIQETLQNLEMSKTPDIMSEVSGVAEQENLDIETSQGKIIVRVPGASLFKPGQADLQLSAISVLNAVVGVVNNYPDYKIHIQGHTDDESISTEKFPTNWELSAGRATAVLRYFYDKGVEPESMTATGYADTFPLATNDTVPGRAKNRRVEFVLEKES